MRLCAGIFLAFFVSASSLHGAIVITEVVDGNRIAADGSAGSSPDPFLVFMELTNTGAADESLTGLHYINFNNGASAAGGVGFSSTALSGTLAAGETFYIAYESENAGDNAFNRTYGFQANTYTGAKFINGDDVLLLLDTEYTGGNVPLDTGTIVDVYGALGTDGTGENWEYTDSFAFRDPTITSPNATFTESEWTFGGINVFDGEGAAFHAANTSVTPPAAVPEPTSLLLAGLFACGSLAVRRRRS